MTEPLPGILARVAEECGEGIALRFAAEFGGQEIYMPDAGRVGPEHRLAQALGLDTARRIAEALSPPGRMIVPLGPTSSLGRRKAEIRRLVDAGKPVAHMARALGVHERTVYFHKARLKEQDADRGPDLFDPPASKAR